MQYIFTHFRGFILLQSLCFILIGQSKYPVDSVITNPDVSILRKFSILPIAGWQRISYNTDFLNCQYYPSCSNYGAEAIHLHGILFGSFMAADRIVRCNPAAYYYHTEIGMVIDSAGYLVDPVKPNPSGNQSKSPLLAAALSALLPGSGRMYSGRVYEGLIGGLMTFLLGQIAYEAYLQNRPIKTSLFTAIFAGAYGGEIYGAYRTAKYYIPQPNQGTIP